MAGLVPSIDVTLPLQLFSSLLCRDYQQTHRLQQPRHPQTLRHPHHALVTGEAAAAAWLMAFPLAGAAIDDEAAVNATLVARRAAKATFFIVASFIKGTGRLRRGRVR